MSYTLVLSGANVNNYNEVSLGFVPSPSFKYAVADKLEIFQNGASVYTNAGPTAGEFDAISLTCEPGDVFEFQASAITATTYGLSSLWMWLYDSNSVLIYSGKLFAATGALSAAYPDPPPDYLFRDFFYTLPSQSPQSTFVQVTDIFDTHIYGGPSYQQLPVQEYINGQSDLAVESGYEFTCAVWWSQTYPYYYLFCPGGVNGWPVLVGKDFNGNMVLSLTSNPNTNGDYIAVSGADSSANFTTTSGLVIPGSYWLGVYLSAATTQALWGQNVYYEVNYSPPSSGPALLLGKGNLKFSRNASVTPTYVY